MVLNKHPGHPLRGISDCFRIYSKNADSRGMITVEEECIYDAHFATSARNVAETSFAWDDEDIRENDKTCDESCE